MSCKNFRDCEALDYLCHVTYNWPPERKSRICWRMMNFLLRYVQNILLQHSERAGREVSRHEHNSGGCELTENEHQFLQMWTNSWLQCDISLRIVGFRFQWFTTGMRQDYFIARCRDTSWLGKETQELAQRKTKRGSHWWYQSTGMEAMCLQSASE
jgi:hypothetical protein